MILIINVCFQKLHYYEFVKPVEDIVKEDFLTKYYLDVTTEDLKNADKIIICGTSLQDNKFLKEIEKFNWINFFDKPIFGICAGFQIIGLVFGGRMKNNIEVGYFHENFKKEFLGLVGDNEVYHLHNNYIEFDRDFDFFNDGNIVQAIKHKKREIYGVLFHPEVRQKKMILEFIRK